MKKIFTLITVMLVCIAANAQDAVLQFCHEDGTIVPDGSTVTVNVPEPEDAEFGIYVYNSGLYIKNTTATSADAKLETNVTAISGELSVCLGTLCRMYGEPGTYQITGERLNGGSINNMQCHWSPALDESGENYLYGECTAECTISSAGQRCSTVTIHFVHADPAGINDISAEASAKNAQPYNIAGQRINGSAKGLIIVDGKKFVK